MCKKRNFYSIRLGDPIYKTIAGGKVIKTPSEEDFKMVTKEIRKRRARALEILRER